MLYKYDNTICDDLRDSFNQDILDGPVVKVIEPENIVSLAAQIQEDKISFPVVALSRDDPEIDRARMNFTRLHQGVSTVFDAEKNEYYNEKVIPISLRYRLTVLTTSTADMDEIIRELMFKYTDMYYLTLTIPYESKRKIRFGIVLEDSIQPSSSSGDYLQSGKLYQTIITLRCEGAVMVEYTPVKLRNTKYEIEASKGSD